MAASPPNLYDELKRVLGELKTFLDQNINTIKPAITAIKQFVPQITSLLDQLIALLGRIKTEIQNFNPGQVGGALTQVTAFTGAVRSLLDSARQLLPNESGNIDDISAVLNVVGSLPSLDQIKGEIIALIDAINGHLNTLKTA